MQEKKYCYVTLTSNNYFHGTVNLFNTLRKHNKCEFLCLYFELEQHVINYIKLFGINLKQIENIENNHNGVLAKKGVFNKLYVFNLCNYEKIIFLDSDLLIFGNIDHLFDTNIDKYTIVASFDGEISNNVFKNKCMKGYFFNSGLFMCVPNSEIFNLMIKNIDNIFSYDGGDQGFINYFFCKHGKINLIGCEYNLWKRHEIVKQIKNLNDIDDLCINNNKIISIHFTGTVKPWMHNNIDNYGEKNFEIINDIWFDLYYEYVKKYILLPDFQSDYKKKIYLLEKISKNYI